MKAALWYLLAGLEVWIGVLAILLGVYALLYAESLSGLEMLACICAIVLGAGLVTDAIRRELGSRAVRTMERFKNPLDSPTRPGQA
jgi:hypothetical protein